MSALWAYFWPALGAGIAVGIIAGAIAFRRRRLRYPALAIGFLLSIGTAAVWHGPLGGADRFSAEVERGIQKTLVYYDMAQVTGHLHHNPLTRRVSLSGQADDFQRGELARLIDDVPGVSNAAWSANDGGLPLIAEGGVVAILGFLLGLLVAYLIELRRRYNTQWNW